MGVCMGRVLCPERALRSTNVRGPPSMYARGSRMVETPGERAAMISRLLIANRGEVAIRIARAAAELGIRTVGVFAEDDEACLHVRRVDVARALRGHGPRAD